MSISLSICSKIRLMTLSPDNIEPKTFATLYKYIERIPFTPDVKKEFLSSIETINFS